MPAVHPVSIPTFLNVNPFDVLDFTDKRQCYITMTNVTKMRIAFKLRLVSAKDYLVRPNSGFIEPNEMITVQVLLQDNYEINMQHKIQIIATDPKGETDRYKVWQNYRADGSTDVQQHTLRIIIPSGNTCITKLKSESSRLKLMQDELEKVRVQHQRLRETITRLETQRTQTVDPRESQNPSFKSTFVKFFVVLTILGFVLVIGYQLAGTLFTQ